MKIGLMPGADFRIQRCARLCTARKWGNVEMDERRKAKRTGMASKIIMKRVDSDKHEEVAIDIVDISKSGLGFVCSQPLQIGEIYESFLTIWTQEVIHAFLRIVRIELKEESYSYGAVFIGMPEMDIARIEVYQTVNEKQ